MFKPTVDLKPDMLALLGVCSDENSSFMRGPAESPPAIRGTLHSGSANLTAESGIDLADNPRFIDAGDISVEDGAEAFMGIEKDVGQIVGTGALPLVLGGDHAITYPVLRAVAGRYGPGAISILHFDAHPDLYDDFEGNRLSNACPFARIMEEGLAKRLVQVGIRCLNAPQKKQAQRFGVEIHEAKALDVKSFDPALTGPVYISFDMDVLDPAFAPGVSHFEPGGLSVRDVISIIHKIEAPIVGADIVEYNPRRDIHNMTAMVAAKMVKEIGGKMLLNAAGETVGSG
jgi:agmatinase